MSSFAAPVTWQKIRIAREVIAEWTHRNWESLNCGLKDKHWNTDVAPSPDHLSPSEQRQVAEWIEDRAERPKAAVIRDRHFQSSNRVQLTASATFSRASTSIPGLAVPASMRWPSPFPAPTSFPA